jgi:hypothetical protein
VQFETNLYTIQESIIKTGIMRVYKKREYFTRENVPQFRSFSLKFNMHSRSLVSISKMEIPQLKELFAFLINIPLY